MFDPSLQSGTHTSQHLCMWVTQKVDTVDQGELHCQHVACVQVQATRLLCRAAAFCDDETRLRRIVPYLVVRLGHLVPQRSKIVTFASAMQLLVCRRSVVSLPLAPVAATAAAAA
jgi:hypothetical protein